VVAIENFERNTKCFQYMGKIQDFSQLASTKIYYKQRRIRNLIIYAAFRDTKMFDIE